MKEYTAEEYRYVLNKIYNMNSEEREKAFGKDEFVADYVEHCSAQEIIEKYQAYVNTPKAGEYWKATDGRMMIVRYIKDNLVYYYYCSDGLSSFMSIRAFVKNFTRTEYKSKYLEVLIEEMKEVSGTE